MTKTMRSTILLIPLVLGLSAEVATAQPGYAPDVTARESASAATITVFPGCAPLLDRVRGAYWTEDGSAVAGEDYESVSGSFALSEGPPSWGHSPRSFRIPLIDDRIREPDETVRVKVLLFNYEVWFGVGAAGRCYGHPTSELIEATLTIVDDDTPRPSAREGS